jgi:transketolase N-terminal domain/subunit
MTMMQSDMQELERTAWRMRLELLRMFGVGKAHHFGGSLSCTESAASGAPWRKSSPSGARELVCCASA